MKPTGITRKVDELGRIVIPIGLRRRLDISEKDLLKIYTSDDAIILKKDQPSCIFCDKVKNVISYKGKNVCRSCIEEIGKKLAE
ncbi:MAG: AbrB/MazE/SpoVT family DNA-binding domain-containing protein [Oscillospiraceae bacterium]|nr:AbrB/MazE/SpoVT family DNA-binding domain-containing protein [Oscillospiraceae bacterium]